jgi:NADP-dependent 3-hydroxy acid dehydrogenase YdfG
MTDRVVVITGATGVLGKLAAQSFAGQEGSLALLSRDQAELDSLARDLKLPSDRILTRAIDLLNAQAVQDSAEAIAEKFGHVDVLIHLVGGWTGGKTIPEASADELTLMLNQHVWTTFNLFHSFTPHLVTSKQGRVIVVSSPLTINPAAKLGIYAAAKSAQENLVLTLAEELRGTAVTANVIQVKSIDVEQTGKGTTPAEIVSAMLFLCGSGAEKITGARMPVYR